MDYKNKLTHSSFNLCSEEGIIEAEKMVSTIEEKMELLQKILDYNPHLRYSWETAEDYIYLFKTFYPDTAYRMEWKMLETLEAVNCCWTFSDAEYYNPYWNWSREQVEEYNKEMEKIYS